MAWTEVELREHHHLDEQPCDDCGEILALGCWCDEPAEVVRGGRHLLIHVSCIREGDVLA